MKQRKNLFAVAFSIIAMLSLILDSQTACSAAVEGIELCLKTVVPSLFPFFFIASVLTSYLIGNKNAFLRPLGRLCRIPEGAEVLFIIGVVGGYPIGARSIREAFDSGAISQTESERMLGFCNNAGPAFLFGISGILFDTPLYCTILYIIMIVSSVLTGILLPGNSNSRCRIPKKNSGNPFKNSINAIATVCGWVILFRILLTFLQKWIFWIFPQAILQLLSGLLEITNGCISLTTIDNAAIRFIILCVILNFGGLCVAMQTASVTGQLSCKYYYIGKIIQSYISLCLAMLAVIFIFPGSIPIRSCIILWIPLLTAMILWKLKNNVGNYYSHGV